MKSPNITPGDWEADEPSHPSVPWTIYSDESVLIGRLSKSLEEAPANAKFICASKKMAEALERNHDDADFALNHEGDGSSVGERMGVLEDCLRSIMESCNTALMSAGYTEDSVDGEESNQTLT